MISVEKPGSPSEILEHHGTKGMKWGVRNKSSSSAPSFRKQFPTSHARTQEIHRARAQQNIEAMKIHLQKNPAKRQQQYKAFLQNPDRATALRMTRGEKVVASIIAVGLPGAGTGAVIGYTGTTVAIRKSIEGAQRRRARQ